MTTADVVVLLFGGRRLPRALRDLATVTIDDVTAHRRVVVVGSDADLAARFSALNQDLATAFEAWEFRPR